jgi:hypothetical protein
MLGICVRYVACLCSMPFGREAMSMFGCCLKAASVFFAL